MPRKPQITKPYLGDHGDADEELDEAGEGDEALTPRASP